MGRPRASGAGTSTELLGGGVEVGDAAVRVDGDQRLAHAGDHRLEAAAQRPRRGRLRSSPVIVRSEPAMESNVSPSTPSSSSVVTPASHVEVAALDRGVPPT